jgi:hypothetical protein
MQEVQEVGRKRSPIPQNKSNSYLLALISYISLMTKREVGLLPKPMVGVIEAMERVALSTFCVLDLLCIRRVTHKNEIKS